MLKTLDMSLIIGLVRV